MRYCEKCGVQVLGTLPCCPLCQGPLPGPPQPQEDVYPPALPVKPRRLFLRLLAWATVSAIIICLAVCLCLPPYRPAAVSLVAGLASGWLMVAVAVKKRGQPLKAVFWQVCLLSLLALAGDWATGSQGWALDYVLPVFYICTNFALAVIARLLHLGAADYLLYLILNILLGLIPLALLVCGLLRVAYPAVACAAISLIFLAALILFQGPALKGELLRRLHL